MTRSELIIRVSELNPHLYNREVEAVVAAILGRIEAALIAGDRVELRDFGRFEARERPARDSRNPRTGEKIAIEAKTTIHFRPGKGMQARLNPREEEREIARLLMAS